MIHWILTLIFVTLCFSAEAEVQQKQEVLGEFSKIKCDNKLADNRLEPTGDCGGLKVLLFKDSNGIGVEYTVCEGGCRSHIGTYVSFDSKTGRLLFYEKESGIHFIGEIKGDALEGMMTDPDWGPDAFEIKLPGNLKRPTTGSTGSPKKTGAR